MIANDADEYVEMLDRTVSIVNSPEYPEYKAQLLETAYKNSWDNKAKEIIELIKDGEKKDQQINKHSSSTAR